MYASFGLPLFFTESSMLCVAVVHLLLLYGASLYKYNTIYFTLDLFHFEAIRHYITVTFFQVILGGFTIGFLLGTYPAIGHN